MFFNELVVCVDGFAVVLEPLFGAVLPHDIFEMMFEFARKVDFHFTGRVEQVR